MAAARCFQQCALESVDSRGRFTFALSGGRTPWLMLGELSGIALPWRDCHLFQVDERVRPYGDEARNLTHIERTLLREVPIPAKAVHPMPVEAHDLQSAAEEYSSTLAAICGTPPILDLVLLGLGTDGHTASLVPGDPVLDTESKFVGITQMYQGSRRMTLTFPVLNRARRLLWLVTGAEKAGALQKLLQAKPSIPGGRVSQIQAIVFADEAAMAYRQPDVQCE
jgi:6-phosphogluconolactonase